MWMLWLAALSTSTYSLTLSTLTGIIEKEYLSWESEQVVYFFVCFNNGVFWIREGKIGFKGSISVGRIMTS